MIEMTKHNVTEHKWPKLPFCRHQICRDKIGKSYLVLLYLSTTAWCQLKKTFFIHHWHRSRTG